MSRTGHWRYRKKREHLKRREDTCWRCGQWIDPDLTFPHPMSWSADHVIPISQGGSNDGELRAAHLLHNQQRNRTPIAQHSRRW